MTELTARRKTLVEESMGRIKALIKTDGVNPGVLEEVRSLLAALTREKALFSEAEFPAPGPDEVAKIYLLTSDEGDEFALYLVSAVPQRGPSPVHNHGTFVVIAGMDGEEANTIYRRLDDGADPDKARLEVTREVVLRDGDSLAFMPNDIHRVQVVSSTPTRHFHLYGKGFDRQTDRLQFNLKEGTAKPAGGSFIPVDESRRVV